LESFSASPVSAASSKSGALSPSCGMGRSFPQLEVAPDA
jgi:hypothetical protein